MQQTRMEKIQKELLSLVEKYGYWSDEVREYNNKLSYLTMSKANEWVRNAQRERNLSTK
jgi:hypothetical protein